MSVERYKESKRILDRAYENNDIDVLAINNEILFDNNDFLEYPFCTSYEWASNFYRSCYDVSYQQFLDYSGDFINPDDVYYYNCIINKTIKFLDNNIDDDNILRYAFIHSLFANNSFSGDYKIGDYHIDNAFAFGLDVILGNSCCRHKVTLLYDVLKNHTDALRISVGLNENKGSDHVILGINDNKKWLFLESTMPYAFLPKSNFELKTHEDKSLFIKAFASYVREYYFKNPFEYYLFFNKLYNKSNISNQEYLELLNKIKCNYEKYCNDKKLIKSFENIIKREREEIQLIYSKK